MTDGILDIGKWKNIYPFLKKVSEVYEELNNNVYIDDSRNSYESLCHIIINDVNGNVEKNKDICMKLMRNLKHFSVSRIDYELSSDRCNILFHWLYNSLNEKKITYDIIDKCFETYDDYILVKGNTNKKCLYYKNHKFHEPTKITLLDIFDNNMNNIEKLLKTEGEEIKFLCRKFVCECLKIYKHMNETYCLNPSEKDQKQQDTCLKLSYFESSYKLLRDSIVSIYPKIPSLDNIDSECLDKHPSLEQEKSLDLRDQGNRSRPYGNVLTEGATDPDGTLAERINEPLENGDNSINKNITTTIGTVAGASSLLALLYRFTPAKRFIHSGLGGRRRRRIDSNFYEGPNELLFDAFKGEDMSPHNARYNIGYGTEGIYE